MAEQFTMWGVFRFAYSSTQHGTFADGSGAGVGAFICLGSSGDGIRLVRTRVTSCMVGRSTGCFLVHRSASWNTFFTSPRSLHVSEISGSTVSMTALLVVLERICAKGGNLEIVCSHYNWSSEFAVVAIYKVIRHIRKKSYIYI